MLKERKIEKKIVDAIASALSGKSDVTVTGLWQPTAAGVLKGLEVCAPKALVEVKTSQIRQPLASVCTIDVPSNVTLIVRIDLDPQGEDFVDYVEPIRDLFQTWMSSAYQNDFTALDTEEISIDGLSVEGEEPQIDINSMVVKVSWGLGLSGCYK